MNPEEDFNHEDNNQEAAGRARGERSRRGRRGPEDGRRGGGRGRRGPRPDFAPPGHGGRPPWLDLFDGRPDGHRRGRGHGRAQVRRGDVRSAILDVLNATEEPMNGYQVIGQIAERSDEAWRPSPGSVYPTIQQLQDEGLIEADETRGRRSLRLTEEGATYCTEHADELAAVWAPFDEPGEETGHSDLRPAAGQVMSAVWQIASTGSAGQREAAIDVLAEARRKLYGILADGDDS